MEPVGLRQLSDLDKDIEILVLRHQLEVLRRKAPRPRLSWSDRAFLALSARLIPRLRWSVFFMTPATLLEWQRKIMRRRWTYPRRPGRPPLHEEKVELICRLARENPRWGYMRISGELKKLGVRVSATAVRSVLHRHGLGPAPRRSGPTWTEFLHARAASLLASDFFCVDTAFGQRFYGLFVIELKTGVVHMLGVTTNPNRSWMAQMARNLVMDFEEKGRRFRFLVRDRDGKFTTSFTEVVKSEGITTIRTPIRAPRANCYAERWIETQRSECLDHLIIVSRGQLERALRIYVIHYNRARPHRGLDLATPVSPAFPSPVGRVERRDVLGGLIHEYERAA